MDSEMIEIKGQELALETSHDGYTILLITIEALTECNYHREADVLIKMAEWIEEHGDIEYTIIGKPIT